LQSTCSWSHQMDFISWCDNYYRQQRQRSVDVSVSSQIRKPSKAKRLPVGNLMTSRMRNRPTLWETLVCLHASSRPTRARSSRTFRPMEKFPQW